MRKILSELRSFLLLWLGQTVSQLGSGMTAFALLVWAFKQEGTVMSVALLSVCSYIPYVLVSVFAGPLVDRLNKKPVILISDAAAALVTCAVFALARAGALEVRHLYAVNFVLGLTGAFQSPASAVAVSLLVPKEHYMRASGLQSLSGSLMGILTPVCATALLAFAGLDSVLLFDLGSFTFAFLTLLCFIRIPAAPPADADEPFGRQLRAGLRFVRAHKGIAHIIRYLTLINLVAGIAFYSVLSPMILARTGGNEMILGYVNTFIGLGSVVGAALVTAFNPRRSKTTVMCVSYMCSFIACDVLLGVGRAPWVWCLAAFLGSLPLPFGDGALTTLLREGIPVEIQGRVFSVRNACVYCAITAGYLAGALLADHVAEPLVAAVPLLRALLGAGEGRAMGLTFVLTGLTGFFASLSLLRDKDVRALER